VNATDSRLGVWSEAGKLRRVMVCAPGLAHQRLTPENCHELLFDDVIWLQQARRDHFDFVAKMVDRGIEVLELQDLLADVVTKPDARCAITTQDPDTGERDLDTLRTILRYRGFRAGDPEHKLDFGVLGEVAVPGRIAVGDEVTVRERAAVLN